MMVEFFKGLSFFILPLGFGCKRMEFFENRIRELGGTLRDENVSHVVVEDSMCEDKKNCSRALRERGLMGKKNIKYVRVKWVSKCLGSKRLVDSKPFEIQWLRNEGEWSLSSGGDGLREQEEAEEEEEEEREISEKKQKIESEKYTCSKPSSSSCGETFQKKKIIEELEKLMNAYNIRNDTWRCHGYRKAINAIKLHGKDISSFQEACSIPGIGEKMASKIMEIIECGKLEKVDEIVDEKTKVLDTFCKIWGVGPSTAEGWYVQGFRTLKDVGTKAKLTKQQRIGLELYEELQKRIPREEVLKIAEVIETEIDRIGGSLDVELVGSFRRGKSDCGDVDLMVVNPGMKSSLEVLMQLTEALRIKGYLTHDLITLEDSNSADDHHHRKYFGVFRLRGENRTHRRLDLFVVPKSEYAAALMHYTGSALFNRSIKLLAAKKDMTLTEHGLYTDTVRKGSEVTCKGQLVATLTERDIFNELGLPYRHPEERDH